jgi:hypothetical protein
MGPLRISRCCPIKDIMVLVMMVGSPKPPLYLTLLSYIGHPGPSNDGRESEKSGSPLFISRFCPIKDIVGPSSDGRESEAPSVSHVVVL